MRIKRSSTIDASLSGWCSRLPSGLRYFLAALWPLLFAVSAISGAFLIAGSLILVSFFGLNNAAFFLNTFYLTVVSLLLTVLLLPLYDHRDRVGSVLAAD